MFPTFISILDVQSWWEVPSIAHFCSLFRTAFNLLDFDIEDLEEALLTDGTEESSWLQELIVLLLKGCQPDNEISPFNYQMFLRRLFRQKCQDQNTVNPFNTDEDFQLLPLRAKVDILHALCDYRLEADDVPDKLGGLEADSLRVEPLGYDANGSAYWYFYGTRLYREDEPGSRTAVWQVVCFTLNDWTQLVKKLHAGKGGAERQLYGTLHENFVPELPRLFREKESLARKRLIERLPRRTSDRLRTKEIITDKVEEFEESITTVNSNQEEYYKKRSSTPNSVEDEDSDKRSSSEEGEVEEAESSEEGRYEMAGAKSKDKKTKKQQKDAESSGGRSNRSSSHSKEKPKTETEVKPVGRQTNNSLASATGQILIQPVSNPHRKKLKTSQVFSQSEEDLQTGLHKILDHVKDHEDAWPFIEPVEEEYAPNYYSIIRKPMDLQRMEERLESGHYKTFSKFKTDFQLIVNNCRLYNGVDNEYTEMVDNLLEVFNRAVERYLDQITSSDEEIAVEYPDAEEKLNKKKKNEAVISPTQVSKRKPMLAAQTDKKRDRSTSKCTEDEQQTDEESVKLAKKNKKEEFKKKEKDKIKARKEKEKEYKNTKKRKEVESEPEVVPKKKQKIEKPPVKDKKHSREKEVVKKKHSKEVVEEKSSKTKKKVKEPEPPPKKSKKEPEKKLKETKKPHKSALEHIPKKPKRKPKKSPSHSRSFSRSPSKDSSPPPSSPPSPDDRFDHPSKKLNRKNNHHSSEDEDSLKNKGKHKPKHDKWKEIFKEAPPPRSLTPSPPPKHKDKHNKLRETIEKLKAKSDLTKLKELDLKVYDFDSDKTKENVDLSKNAKKKPKTGKKDDYEDENSTADSVQSENRNKANNKKSGGNSKNTGNKNSSLEALTLATEQTLKDINKWLDDTPRFPEFSSASNSPLHFSGLDEFDSLNAKNEQDKKKLEKPQPPRKEGQPVKDQKKKPFQRDPTKLFRRREVQRTIDRLQPGKSKGNLISSVQNTVKTDELFPLAKNKDAKNSLTTKQDESAPKLSLGSVLDSFGKHKFVDDEEPEAEVKKEETVEEKVEVKEDKEEAKKEVKDEVKPEPPKLDNSPGKATPNLSAWFKAFGAPKVQPTTAKKAEAKEEVGGKVEAETKKEEVGVKKVPVPEPSPNPDSPLMQGQPVPRQRKISTGSSMSERSSFSQDMDSPRVGIDERLGAYPAPYPSPLHKSPSGASPNLRSPLPDASPKSTAYPFNGQIRVGFYQDTVSTKSSPDKSCSPRDNPQSPYGGYSEHVYTPQTTPNGGYGYGNPYYTQPPTYSTSNPTPPYQPEVNSGGSTPGYYDTSKPLTDQYQAKNSVTSPLSISSAASPVQAQLPSPQMSQQQSPSVDGYKQVQSPYSQQQNSPNINYNQQQSPNIEAYRQQSCQQQQPQQLSPVDRLRQQEVIQSQPSPNLEVYNQQASPNIEQYRQQQQQQQQQQQHQQNLELLRQQAQQMQEQHQQQAQQQQQAQVQAQVQQQQQQQQVITAEKPQQPATAFPVKKRAYNEIDQGNRFEDQFHANRLMAAAEQQQRTIQQQQQQTQPQELNVRNIGFSAASNPYNYNDAYALNIPTAARNLEINYQTRNTQPQQYNKPDINFTKLPVTATETEGLVNMSGYNNKQASGETAGGNQAVTIPRPTYTNPANDLDQSLALRANLPHIVDRFQNEFYGDKTAQHMFSKQMTTSAGASGLPMYSQQTTMAYAHGMQSTMAGVYNRPITDLQSGAMMGGTQQEKAVASTLQQAMQEKKPKRSKKAAKNATSQAATMETVSTATQNQGFQSYSGLKTQTNMEPSAISLKTASVVPGSAFNFGPSATGLGLGPGIYGDKDAYPNFLEDFRSAPNYYMAAAAAAHHRSTPEAGEKPQARSAHQPANAQAPGYPFLGAPQPRPPGYPLGAPFIPPHQGALMDASSPLYQQYLQAGVLHQGLLGPPGPYPPGYHPALSMRQPYDSMPRPSWL